MLVFSSLKARDPHCLVSHAIFDSLQMWPLSHPRLEYPSDRASSLEALNITSTLIYISLWEDMRIILASSNLIKP